MIRLEIFSLSRGTSLRAMRFGAFSGVSFLTNIAATYVLTEIVGTPAEVSFLVSLVLVFFVNFACCRWFVFGPGDLGVRSQLASFFISTVLFRTAEYAAFLSLHSLAGVDYLASAAIVLITGFLAKFAVYSRVVFRRPDRETNSIATDHSSAAGSVRTDSSPEYASEAALSDAGRTPASR